jgi:tryptophan synthase alpha chain
MALQFSSHPFLVVYMTCGDPDLTASKQIILSAIAAGADVIELGVPFSDPVADGPVIQRASERALANHTTLNDVLKLAAEVRKTERSTGLIVFSYYNPVLRYGLERFCDDARSAGVDGALITDLTVEEAGDYVAAMRRRDLATVFLAAPTSTDQRLKAIASASRGFLYAVSRTGVTGTQQKLAEDAGLLVRRIKKFTKLPVAVGFGISNSEQFHAAGRFADGVVVGSAIVHTIEQNVTKGRAAEAVGEFIRELKKTSAPRTQHSAR